VVVLCSLVGEELRTEVVIDCYENIAVPRSWHVVDSQTGVDFGTHVGLGKEHVDPRKVVDPPDEGRNSFSTDSFIHYTR
jgi:hypothetical protein